MLGITDQIQLAAEHARRIVTDISKNRDAQETLALLRPYFFEFERNVRTLELQERMRQVFTQRCTKQNSSEKKLRLAVNNDRGAE